MNPTSIETCKICEQLYCIECSDAKKWQKFCSQDCEDKGMNHGNQKNKKRQR